MPERTVSTIRAPRPAAEDRRAVVNRRWRGWVACERTLVAAVMATVIWFFHWTVEANSGFEDWGDMDYFKLMVRGWKKGQLNLDKDPAPELLALRDPYDPEQNGPYKLGDATLYKGKYYIYFGPAPALTLMFPYAVITGRELTTGHATFVFCSLGFLVASGLWLKIRRRYFPQSGLLIAPLGVAAIGFGTHLLALTQRPMMWELPISAGVAFTMLAVSAAYWATHGRRPLVAMALAGLCAGLAVGSRPTCLFAGVLVVPVWQAWRERRCSGDWWRMGFAALIPFAGCGLAIMAHNYARFDNPLEWGQNYQLSGAYEGKLTHFSLRFLLHNLSVYLFQLLRWSSEFPFTQAIGIQIDHIPGYFGTEEVAGLMVTFPFLWFALALPLVFVRRTCEDVVGLRVTLLALGAYVVPVMALVMCYFSTTTRYQTDFAVGLAVLAMVGLLGAERWAQMRAQRWPAMLVGAAAIAAVACTVVVGTLMSFDYHNRAMQIASPVRWQAFDGRMYELIEKVGLTLRQVEGPRVVKVRFRQQPIGRVETFWKSHDPRAGERIVIEHIGERLIRFGYGRGTAPIAWGRPLKWNERHTHTVSVQLPSLYPSRGDGWWGGVQQRMEFRRRSSVAIWFSGGRALGQIVPRLPDGITPGGAVDTEFSGEIRDQFPRVYRLDEVESGLVDFYAKRGGVLWMRMMFPEKLQAKGEPIFASGAHYRSSIVYVETASGGMRFVFENFGANRVESPVFQPNPEGHVVELEMPSFDPERYGEEATGDVVVRLDGRELLRTRQVAYPSHWGAEQIGRNPFGTTCAAEFRGWIYQAKWVLPGASETQR